MRNRSLIPALFASAVRPVQQFLRLEASSGVLLLVSAVAALVWANLHPESYARVFQCPLTIGAGDLIATFTLRDAINDGLMAIFFFVVGLEIKRELVVGELNSLAKASLPVFAALGGMIVPAAIFLAFTFGQPGAVGWGVPMATDIAFCVGVLTLLKGRVPRSLVVFVTALAIFDDIGGILVIAIFYGHGTSVPWLLVAGVLSLVLVCMGRARVTHGLAYAVVGAALWHAIHSGGLHPTIAGVVLGLTIPARSRNSHRSVLEALQRHLAELLRTAPDEDLDEAQVIRIENDLEEFVTPVQRYIHALHPLVAFVVMPVFALANSGVSLAGLGPASLTAPVALGVAAGLVIGKPLGIFCFTMLALRLGVSPMPKGASRAQIFGVSVIAGIGFTVALFIAALAYAGMPDLLDQAKIGILAASVSAGILGFAILRFSGASTDRGS